MIIPIGDDNPAHRPPVATIVIIGLCAAAFLYQITLTAVGEQRFAYRFGMIPARLFGTDLDGKLPIADIAPWLTIITSMFVHGNFMHLAGNMLFLWICGNNVEDRLGHARYVLFYLLCGVAAALLQAVVDTDSPIPMVGASGAISGVLGAYLILYPHARILILAWVAVLRIRAVFAIGIWFIMQLLNAIASDPEEGGVAWFAHIGGFLAGMALVFVFAPREPVRVARGPWG
jgi:membrane associated rhomboid family serine protease